MSCHEIGHGMNNVVKNILAIYDAGSMDAAVARRLIAVARKSVNYCDGNEDEAVAVMHRHRCGYCLRKVKDGGELIDLYGLFHWNAPERNLIDSVLDPRESEDPIGSWELCRECFDNVIQELLNNSSPRSSELETPPKGGIKDA